jgi:hypothetical protein
MSGIEAVDAQIQKTFHPFENIPGEAEGKHPSSARPGVGRARRAGHRPAVDVSLCKDRTS